MFTWPPFGIGADTSSTRAAMDEHIKHICDQVGMGLKNRKKMEEFGICTVADLLQVEARIEQRELDGLPGYVKKKLVFAAKWKLSNPDADFIEDFDGDDYSEWYEVQQRMTFAEKYISCALGRPYTGENVRLSQEVNEDELLLKAVVNRSKEIIMRSSNLREKCGNFDYDSFIEKAILHFHALVDQESSIRPEKHFIVSGQTQSGKSAIKGVVQSLCGLLKIPLVILTKGVGESIDLHAKLVNLSEGTLMSERHIIVASSKNDGMGYKAKDVKIEEAFEGETHGGVLVVADTCAQVLRKACKAIESYKNAFPSGKLVIITDEADAMIRTEDRHQKFEQAYAQLKALVEDMPRIELDIGATQLPVITEVLLSGDGAEERIEFINVKPQDVYIGIDDIKPLEIDGEKVYLEQNELSGKFLEYEVDGVTICCANEKNIALYDDAFMDVDGRKKGILVLDCTDPRVTALNNMWDKANAVQELYGRRGKQVIVIVYHGSGISSMKASTSHEWDNGEREDNGRKYKLEPFKLIGSLLRHIDDTYGLDVPVIIYGYAKMCRGISFRSDGRVPTHMIMALGRGHNTSTIVQTIGRITSNGRDVLKKNGFDFVTILCTSSDYTLCKRMNSYINHVSDCKQEGDTLAAAVTGENKKIPASANPFGCTFREMGKIKGRKRDWEDMVDVAEDVPAELSDADEDTKKKLWGDENAQRLLRSLAHLRKTNELVDIESIDAELVDREEYLMPRKTLRELVKMFCDRSLIRKVGAGKDTQYKVPAVERLMRFINPDISDDDELSDGDEDYVEEDGQSVSSEDGVADIGGNRHSLRSNVVSNVSDVTGTGSRDSPYVFPDSGDESITSHHSATSVAKGTTTAKLVTPNGKDPAASDPQYFVGERVAKLFSMEVKFGTVESYHDGHWQVGFDDRSEEGFDENGLYQALRLYERERTRDKTAIDRLPLTNIEDIPEVAEIDESKMGTCIVQQEKKRRVYYTTEGDTPDGISKRFGVDVCQIIRDNERREGYTCMRRDQALVNCNTPIVLPLESKSSK